MKLTYQKQKSKSQSGRSMAEILGVLALIGVLSLGALSGYAWAMNKYRSNVLTQEILERASDIKGQLDQRHRHITLDKWDSISLIGYEIGLEDNQAVTEGTKTTAAIQVKGVKEEVCQMTFDNLAKMMSIEIRQEDGVALGTASDKCQDGCTMVFFLDDEWEYSRTAPVQPACDVNTMPKGANPETCECDAETQMEVDGQCVCLNGDIPLNGLCVECVTEEDCNSGNYVCENHTCSCVKQDCPNSDFADTICSCCPDDKPIWIEEEGVCKSCAEIDLTKPVYNKETKECEACPDGTMWDGAVCVSCPDDKPIWNDITKTCEACPDDKQVWDEINERCVECLDNSDCGTGFVCTDNQCTCETGSETRCASDLIETVIGPSAYGQLCYTCSCPDGSTLSGDTCICTNECKTYNATEKRCDNKPNGTACSGGLCKTGVCTSDTCSTGQKSCASGYTATKVSTTAYGTACYRCCTSPKVWNGSSCVCPSGTPTYANTSTCACNSGETNKNGVCTPDLYSPCATYCQTRNSTSSGTFQNCRNMTTTSKLNLVLYLQHTVSANGTKSYTLVSSNTLKTNGANETYTYPLSTGKTYFETFCEYGYATYKGSYYYLEWTKASSNSLCNGLISGSSASCYTSNSKEISNAQKTTCDSFCTKYASRYGW